MLRAASIEKCRATLARPFAASRVHRASSVQAQYRRGERLRGVGDQHVAAIDQVHAFRRGRGRDHRQAVRHRLVDLALDPAP